MTPTTPKDAAADESKESPESTKIVADLEVEDGLAPLPNRTFRRRVQVMSDLTGMNIAHYV